MKIIKKNQLTILVLALMLVTAGYLNYNSNQTVTTEGKIASIGDATLVSSNSVVSDNNTIDGNSLNTTNDIVSNSDSSSNITVSDNNITENNVVTTNSEAETKETDYYTSSRLERDTMYSEMLESYQKILDSTTTESKQKEEAQKEITNINTVKNAIMISENLIKTKGFEDCIVFSNDNSVNVVIKKETLTKEDTAQIQSIIAREMSAKLENIHIMTK